MIWYRVLLTSEVMGDGIVRQKVTISDKGLWDQRF